MRETEPWACTEGTNHAWVSQGEAIGVETGLWKGRDQGRKIPPQGGLSPGQPEHTWGRGLRRRDEIVQVRARPGAGPVEALRAPAATQDGQEDIRTHVPHG